MEKQVWNKVISLFRIKLMINIAHSTKRSFSVQTSLLARHLWLRWVRELPIVLNDWNERQWKHWRNKWVKAKANKHDSVTGRCPICFLLLIVYRMLIINFHLLCSKSICIHPDRLPCARRWIALELSEFGKDAYYVLESLIFRAICNNFSCSCCL